MTPLSQSKQASFNPYAENGGTILAIAGLDFAVVAGDTRQTEGYSIQTRYAPKVFRLCVLNSLPADCLPVTVRFSPGLFCELLLQHTY